MHIHPIRDKAKLQNTAQSFPLLNCPQQVTNFSQELIDLFTVFSQKGGADQA